MSLAFHPVDARRSWFDHVDASLSRGADLCGMTRPHVRGWDGRGLALFPRAIGAAIPPLDQGGVGVGDAVLPALAQFLSFEAVVHDKTIVVEHMLAKRGDPFISALPINPTYLRQSVLLMIEAEAALPERIEAALSHCFTALGLAAFVAPRRVVSQVEELGDLDAQRLCEAIEAVVVGVFDNETFLLWQRHTAAPTPAAA